MGAVTTFQFAIGNGVATAFTLMDPSGFVAGAPTVTALYKKDWQGNQLLYPTSRTNLSLRSGIDVAWNGTRSTVNVNAGADLSGGSAAATLIEDSTASNSHYVVGPSATILSATVYTASIYVKAKGRTWIGFQGDIAGGNIGGAQYYDVSNGVVGALGSGITSRKITNMGNGWYRCELTATSTGITALPGFFLATGDGAPAYSGDGVSGVYFWGAQIETGVQATSYIPTVAAAATVTDYSAAGTVVTVTPAPVAGACLAWTGTDSNGPFIPGHSGASVSSSFGNMGAR